MTATQIMTTAALLANSKYAETDTRTRVRPAMTGMTWPRMAAPTAQ